MKLKIRGFKRKGVFDDYKSPFINSADCIKLIVEKQENKNSEIHQGSVEQLNRRHHGKEKILKS